MGGKINAHRFLVIKLVGKEMFQRRMRRWDDNITTNRMGGRKRFTTDLYNILRKTNCEPEDDLR
jgi:hypothetical protein